MKIIKIIFSYGFLGGIMVILIHLLGSVIYYLAGLLLPVAFIASIWLALSHTYRVLNYFNFLLFFKISNSVYLIAYSISLIYAFLTKAFLGDFKENIIAAIIVLFLGIILSSLVTFVFNILKVKKKL